jgi:hypothetical protein
MTPEDKSMSAAERRITRADIVPLEIYARERGERRRALISVKKNRRVEVGPFATFYFENFDTMLAQVQEMLHIEKGGEEQIEGELEAYNPLIPQGRELIATLMLEIDDPVRRVSLLKRLAGIEESVHLDIGRVRIKATPTDYEDRTSEDGKTSSVHWVRFSFTPDQVASFRSGKEPVILGVAHANYGHLAIVPSEVRAELAKDFA